MSYFEIGEESRDALFLQEFLQMKAVAFYPGSFDPITNGHMDILEAGLSLADTVVLAMGVHPTKTTLFTREERLALIDDAVAELGAERAARVRVIAFDDLAIAAARREGASVLIRGLRNAADFDYEMQMAATNAVLADDIQTVFLPASPRTRHVTATLVRQIARMGGDISEFVPAAIVDKVVAKARS